MPLEVIGCGFGRTGTMSLYAALQELGYPCHHMREVFKSREQLRMWDQLGRGEAVSWEKVFDGYRAAVDFPTAGYWRELTAVYPKAKVILTIRDAEGWYASVMETIYSLQHLYHTSSIWRFFIRISPFARTMVRMHQNTVWNRVFNGITEGPEGRENLIRRFNEHTAEVRATIPPEQLLVYHPREGWGPLCAFLGVPVPPTPFPNINDREEFIARMRIGKVLIAGPPIVLITLAVAVVGHFAFRVFG